jgi:putative transposase
MFLIRGIVFSHEAVSDWETKLAAPLAENLRRRWRGGAGPSRYVDERYIKVRGHGCVATFRVRSRVICENAPSAFQAAT